MLLQFGSFSRWMSAAHTMNNQTIYLGTRGSALARWQTGHVRQLLQMAWPDLKVEIRTLTTQGDRVLDTPLPMIGGKGVFTMELEEALRNRSIDYAVHSLKDLPTEEPSGLRIGAVPGRAALQDALVSRKSYRLTTLPAGATVGTSSRRRAAQLLRKRPDLQIADIRGNVDTRIRKALDPEGIYDAVILASAGLERLQRTGVVSEQLSLEDMMPAPGQGALAVQCRDEDEAASMLAPINHLETQIAVTAERAFLAGLGGGCALPIGGYATLEDGKLRLRGRVTALDGTEQIDVELVGQAELEAARSLGGQLARMALDQGVRTLLEQIR
jgi:hydroxymethylbilane synthase